MDGAKCGIIKVDIKQGKKAKDEPSTRTPPPGWTCPGWTFRCRWYARRHRGFDGSESPAGCLFFSAADGGDGALYRVIYGHNLHDGSMFGALLRYRDPEFYARYPTFTLYTPEGAATYRIFSCHTATDTEPLYRTDRRGGLRRLFAAADRSVGV